ncbi:MAG: TIGR00730 family Rossman fold protein [Planctomycetota bacterium]|nr:TIGR00730 family Rossman fold protein [Planctomycetota bacterium]
MKSVTIYCSSSASLNSHFTRTAEVVGRELAARGLTLVYGAGLMGDVARACASAGGEVVGVITHYLAGLEVAFEGCTELITVETMRDRKRIMVERGDAFLVLPGGLGTYEEFFETLVGRVLAEHDKPVGIVNDHGYFDPLLAMIDHGIEQKFIRPAIRQLLSIDRDAIAVLHALAEDRGHGLTQADLIPPLGQLES